jgi:hypothetical protein
VVAYILVVSGGADVKAEKETSFVFVVADAFQRAKKTASIAHIKSVLMSYVVRDCMSPSLH